MKDKLMELINSIMNLKLNWEILNLKWHLSFYLNFNNLYAKCCHFTIYIVLLNTV